MFIERFQVEEGFLTGLDVSFTPGLNVIIGARGTGKTSLIELIRYCLDAHSSGPEISKKSKQHALSILGSGQVTARMSTGGKTVIVSRTASDAHPRFSGEYQKPIIFSQTEIETIGLESSGRLRLIDGFIPNASVDEMSEKQITSNIISLTSEVTKLRRELDELENATRDIVTVDVELKDILAQEAVVANSSSALSQKAMLLQTLSDRISYNSSLEFNVTRAQSEIYSWYSQIKTAMDFSGINDPEVVSSLVPHASKVSAIKEKLESAHSMVVEIWQSLDETKKKIQGLKISDESLARDSRQEIEVLQAGAGDVMRRGQSLREKKAKLESLANLFNVRKQELTVLIQRRDLELDRLEKHRTSRFETRLSVIKELNASLGPSIRIGIKMHGQQNIFSSLIADMLRGSGLKYNDIAPMLASTISPRMLLETVENFDVSLMSDVSGLALDRSARVLTHLRNVDLGAIGVIDIEDEVFMQLLDGTDYKDISELSTGQRCTVILPIVLAHKGRIVIVDQPEDHIDNAFITSTLIRAVLSRNPTGQIIFSTHNPNIPVLGAADNVVHLASDGRRGYVTSRGSLNEACIVESISTVMEGGSEAFSKRSAFYSQNEI